MATSRRDLWAKDDGIVNGTQTETLRDDMNPPVLDSFTQQLWRRGASRTWLAKRWVDKPLEFIV